MPRPERDPFATSSIPAAFPVTSVVSAPVAIPLGVAPGRPGPALPLRGLTILVVEDSRYACEALRLIAQRAGARLRRAETLETARAHLRTYRPDVAIIDLGLPDGRGERLISELAQAQPRSPAILGMSGLPEGRQSAMAAGADGFLEKPLAGYGEFCAVLSRLLPDRHALLDSEPVFALPEPDPLALHDDLERAAEALRHDPDLARLNYLTGFLSGLARVSHDADLAEASQRLFAGPEAVEPLRALVDDRLAGEAALVAPARRA